MSHLIATQAETEMLESWGWAFWADAEDLGDGIFWKGEWVCICRPGTLPGDADSLIRPIDRRAMYRAQDEAARAYWAYPGREWQEGFQRDWVRAQFA
jgi:hypothetical protein